VRFHTKKKKKPVGISKTACLKKHSNLKEENNLEILQKF
jgi:hypothetical protein